jgi:hypothetical protein
MAFCGLAMASWPTAQAQALTVAASTGMAVCYRVMGTKLVTVASNGTVTVLGDVGGPTTELVTMDYSFDVLAIASGGRLYYWIPVNTTATSVWNPTAPILRQVTDPDLGVVLDFCWVDGYFMTTDGANLVVTELSDPTAGQPAEVRQL